MCETGRGTAQFMLAKLRTLEEVIEIVSVSSVHNTGEIKRSGANMIISTIPIEKQEIPCIVVRSAMLNTDDILDIQKMALEVMEGIMEPNAGIELDVINPEEIHIQGAFYEWLSENRIEVDYEAKDWKDAVNHAGELLYKDGAVEERYIQAMIQKIETYGPYIVICPGTALPHADAEEGVIYEAASLIRLKKPIEFHHEMNDPVKYVIGMSVKSAESVNQAIYDLMMIFGNERIRQILDKAVDKASIMEALDGLTTAK